MARPALHCLVLALVLAFAASALAHDGESSGDAATAAPVSPATADSQAMVATVDAFGEALHAADLAKVAELLDDAVLVLESGGAERSKAQYLAEHAGADADFLREAHVQQTQRTARVTGDMGWVGTESEIHATHDGKPMTLLSTETMVLQRAPGGPWRIVHIHWSSRPKKE